MFTAMLRFFEKGPVCIGPAGCDRISLPRGPLGRNITSNQTGIRRESVEMLRQFLAATATSAAMIASALTARAADETPRPSRQDWSFDGVFGTYDRASAQRGFQVYKEVCSACHPVKHLHFRDLADIGYTDDEVKAIASTYQVTNEQPNDQGEMFQRPGRPSDPIPGAVSERSGGASGE